MTEPPKPAAAAHISPPATGPSWSVVGDVYTIRASGEQTGGTLCLIEARIGPGCGPPPHVHEREDESFYVLDGTVTFFTADGAHVAAPGTMVHLPRGVPHHFRNESDHDARMLIWCTPGGFDRFVAAVGDPLSDVGDPAVPPTPVAIERLVATCPEFGLRILERLG